MLLILQEKNNIKIINKFLNLNVVEKFNLEKKLIVFILLMSFCHIKNLREIFSCVEKMLKKNSYFIFEDPYLGEILKKGFIRSNL